MAVRTRDELMELVRARIADDTSDEAIALIEDMSDTLNDYDNRINDSGDWRQRYIDNDTEWRNKYKERFFSGVDTKEEDATEEVKTEVKTFDELFKED